MSENLNPVESLERKIAELRFLFNRALPLLGHLVNNVPVRVRTVGTALCTPKGQYGEVSLDPGFCADMSRGQVGAIWLHEMFHLAFGYFSRRGNRDKRRFNEAHDYVVNLMIEDFRRANPDLGLTWPTGDKAPLLDERFAGMAAEMIYDLLVKEPPPEGGGGNQGEEKGEGQGSGQGGGEPQAGDAEGSEGSEEGGQAQEQGGEGRGGPQARDGGQGYPDATDCVDDPGSDTPQDQESMERMERRWRNLLAEATNVQKMRGAGRLPGSWVQLVEAALQPRLSWVDQLLHATEGHLRGGALSYRRPSKRSEAAGVMLPGRGHRQVRLGVVVDTSASVGTNELKAFLGVMRQVMDSNGAALRLIQVDTDITADDEVEDPDALAYRPFRFLGRGGTDFGNVPEQLQDGEGDPVDLAVLLTDGEPCYWPEHSQWPCPLVVVTTRTMPPAPYQGIRLELAGLS